MFCGETSLHGKLRSLEGYPNYIEYATLLGANEIVIPKCKTAFESKNISVIDGSDLKALLKEVSKGNQPVLEKKAAVGFATSVKRKPEIMR